MQALRCVSEQVAVLVDGGALGRHVAPRGGQCLLQQTATVNDQELWLAQPALDEINALLRRTECPICSHEPRMGSPGCRVARRDLTSGRCQIRT